MNLIFIQLRKRKGGGCEGSSYKRFSSPSWGGLGISERIKCHRSELIKTIDA